MRFVTFVTAFYFNILLLTVSNPTLASSKECDFPAIFNFGDSISDTGGLSAAFTPPPWPYGISYFHMSTGRESDGRLLIDFIEGVFKKLLPKEDYFSRALYTFDIGSNDLAGDYYINMSRENVSAALTDMLNQYTAVLKDLSTALESVVGAGANTTSTGFRSVEQQLWCMGLNLQ
ncbi:GDSL esterase/lipase-like protein isoform X2 [Cinnamomum micranthum f. kanehirae]|uniref:GDSL esterase/lipase-like protein isoform X2 n=1 Tax=Cinnamomum micranthum f. kanehirae TaxID=337451 RepID=A0A3S3P4U5_9MAGN|nr:GDSL esterase/lipase-like protein isoform X2 [Cinnamomum micranthum f. kanehirae]